MTGSARATKRQATGALLGPTHAAGGRRSIGASGRAGQARCKHTDCSCGKDCGGVAHLLAELGSRARLPPDGLDLALQAGIAGLHSTRALASVRCDGTSIIQGDAPLAVRLQACMQWRAASDCRAEQDACRSAAGCAGTWHGLGASAQATGCCQGRWLPWQRALCICCLHVSTWRQA